MSLAALATILCLAPVPRAVSPWEREVIYQIFPRSFCDSNGDRIGDFKGIASKLDYLTHLGVTTLLINPIQASPMYHNYFADDFMATDPKLGTNAEFFDLVRQAHRRRLKVILDMEVQYVTERHSWYKDKPGYLWDNKGFLTSVPLPLYDGQKVRVFAIDPANPAVLHEVKKVFRYWAAPNGDPKAGVDGFRLDHLMDDFDWQKVKTGMLANFWHPVIADIRSMNPKAFFLGEQSDWDSQGADIYAQADVDAVYAIPQWKVLMAINAATAQKAIDDSQTETPIGKTRVNFIENHDVSRFASNTLSDAALLRLGAVLNLTLKGTPMIYYGQELGMQGKPGKWGSDGNDIPLRLAFRWNRWLEAPGTAGWYWGTGAWAEQAFSTNGDGISVEEAAASGSLLNFYRKLIRLRRSNVALREGVQSALDFASQGVVGFVRTAKTRVAVLANMSQQIVRIEAVREGATARDLWTGKRLESDEIAIPPHGFRLIEYR